MVEIGGRLEVEKLYFTFLLLFYDNGSDTASAMRTTKAALCRANKWAGIKQIVMSAPSFDGSDFTADK